MYIIRKNNNNLLNETFNMSTNCGNNPVYKRPKYYHCYILLIIYVQ